MTDIQAILGIVVGLLVGWLASRGYHRYWDRVEAEESRISAEWKARYDAHKWDELIVDQPDVFIGDLGAGPRFVVRVPYDHEAES